MAIPILILSALLSVFSGAASSPAPNALSAPTTSGDVGAGVPTASAPVDDVGGGFPTHH